MSKIESELTLTKEIKQAARRSFTPKFSQLAEKTIGLDSLMNLAGLNSFATDQAAMNQRVQEVLAKR